MEAGCRAGGPSHRRRRTNDPDVDGFPLLSPDGHKLVWASNRHGSESGETDLIIADWVE